MPSLSGLNILGVRAVTRKDGLAIDVFYVEVENSGLVEDKKPKICVSKISNPFSKSKLQRIMSLPNFAKNLNITASFQIMKSLGNAYLPKSMFTGI